MPSIVVKNASLDFPIFTARDLSIKQHLIRLGTGGLIGPDSKGHTVVSALRDIDLVLEDGARVGLIGHNGSGKSTLMKMIAGIYHPTSGSVHVEGRLSTIFELGIGSDPELSGRENIIRIGAMMGIPSKRLSELLPEVAEFTELGDFLSLPVRTYSAGMAMRLYFAMAMLSAPDILLIDEVFGAGDAAFQRRAQEKLVEQISSSRIFVLASHSDDLVRRFCDRCVVMSHGRIVAFDQTEVALAKYSGAH